MTEHAQTVEGLHKILGELIDKGHGQDIVVMSRDAEGNHFSPLPSERGLGWDLIYTPETTWFGEICSKDEEDRYQTEHSKPAITLWPTN